MSHQLDNFDFLNNTNALLLVLNQEMEIIYFNNAFGEILKDKVTIGMKFSNFIYFEDKSLFKNVTNDNFDQQQKNEICFRLETNLIWYYWDINYSNGKYYCIGRKVTDKKLDDLNVRQTNEKLLRLTEDLKEFSYIISHDLKTPVRGIKQIAEWIVEDYWGKLDDKGKEFLQLLHERALRLSDLIDGINQYTRIRLKPGSFTKINVEFLIETILDDLAPSLEGIEIEKDFFSKPIIVYSDETRFRQIFMNLLTNSIKFMDQAKPKKIISIGCTEYNEDYYQFYVKDNGIGIEDRFKDKIFQLFNTLSNLMDKSGLGLGLSITKKIVELYGGEISFESNFGEGSTFFFTYTKSQEIII